MAGRQWQEGEESLGGDEDLILTALGPSGIFRSILLRRDIKVMVKKSHIEKGFSKWKAVKNRKDINSTRPRDVRKDEAIVESTEPTTGRREVRS